MPPVNPPEHIIINRFNPIFNHDEIITGHQRQPVKQLTADAVRTGTYDNASHQGVVQRLIIKGSQSVNTCVCICICLEICNIVFCTTVSQAVKGYPLLYLFRHTFIRGAVTRYEGLVIAIGASSVTKGSVTVGACESCVYAQLLHPSSDKSGKPVSPGVEPSGRSPTIYCFSVHSSSIVSYPFSRLPFISGS